MGSAGVSISFSLEVMRSICSALETRSVKSMVTPRMSARMRSTASAPLGSTKYPEVSPMEVCAEREHKAREESVSDLAVVRSKGNEERLPLIIVLHGNMQNLPICQEDWRGAEWQGFDLAFVRSSQLTFSDAFVWTDLEVGARDLGEQLRVLKDRGELDDRKVIMAGFSAGARMALHAVMTGMVKADGMVLVGPWLPEMDKWSAAIKKMGDHMPGAHIICGDQDADCLPGAKLLADTLGLMGRPCQMRVPAGLAHEYPDDFVPTLRTAIEAVIGKGSEGN